MFWTTKICAIEENEKWLLKSEQEKVKINHKVITFY
jgi:hypothetical protein